MNEILWKAIAKIVSNKYVADYLIKRSKKTPYFDLPGYMERDWLFNPYDKDTHEKKYKLLPSIRVHHILRADLARHPHDHPWDARTIIMKGAYSERRMVGVDSNNEPLYENHLRMPGDTATIRFGEYHSIDSVSDGGVYTLFITYKYRGMWGFWVDGVKIPWRAYDQAYPENVSPVVERTSSNE